MAAEGTKQDDFLQECLRDIQYRYGNFRGKRLTSEQEDSLYFWLEDNLELGPEEQES